MSKNTSEKSAGLSSKILKMRFMSRTKDEELKRKLSELEGNGEGAGRWKVDLTKLNLEKPKLKVQYDHNTIDQLKFKSEQANKLSYLIEENESSEDKPSRMSFGGFNKKLEEEHKEIQDDIKNQPSVSDEKMAEFKTNTKPQSNLKSSKSKGKKRAQPY